MEFIKYIKEVKEKAKKRKFLESMEIIFNFKNLDFSKQENRFNLQVFLPKGRGKKVACGIFAEGSLQEEAKKLGFTPITKTELNSFKKDKKLIKGIIKKCKFFLAQPDMMQIVAKNIGQILGPKGKMPKPIPPKVNLKEFAERFQNTIQLKSKGKFLPTVQAIFGSVEMSEEDLNINANAIYDAFMKKLNNNQNAIKSIYLKTSMSPAVKVDLPWIKKEKQ